MRSLAILGVLVAALLLPVAPAAAGADPAGAATELFALANAERRAAGLAPLVHHDAMATVARTHSEAMAAAGDLFHNDDFFTSATKSVLGIAAGGENVGVSGSADAIHRLLMDSPLHRANILNPAFDVGGFGVARRGSVLYATENFGSSRAGTVARSAPRPATTVATPPPPTRPKPPAPSPTTTAPPPPPPSTTTSAAPPAPPPVGPDIALASAPAHAGTAAPALTSATAVRPSPDTPTSLPARLAAAAALVVTSAATARMTAGTRRRRPYSG